MPHSWKRSIDEDTRNAAIYTCGLLWMFGLIAYFMRACITDVLLAELAFQNNFSKRDGVPPLQERLAFK